MGWLSPLVFQSEGFAPAFLSLILGPPDRWGICPAATMGWEGCNTFSQPRNLIGGLFSAMDSLAIPAVASSSGVLTGVSWCSKGQPPRLVWQMSPPEGPCL